MSSQSDPGNRNARDESPPLMDNQRKPSWWPKVLRTDPDMSLRSFNLAPLKRKTGIELPINDISLQTIELLFGLGRPHILAWPGLRVVVTRLETEFKVFLRDDFSVIWTIIGQERPVEAHECWHWCLAVLQAFQSLQANENVSMDNVCKYLSNKGSVSLKAPERDTALLAIFAVLCWTSKMLVPVLEPEKITDSSSSLCFRAKGVKISELSQTSLDTTARRPIAKLFGILKALITGPEHVAVMGAVADTDTIHESSVNFFSLHTIGRVRIKWVEDLVSHLAFDWQTKTLSVFSLPTFCASSILRTQEIKILQQVSSELIPSTHYTDYDDQDKSSLHREVLLTYRLLFGQSSRSRSLALKLCEQLKTESGDVDPFLVTLCTVPTTRSRFFRRTTRPELPPDLFPSSVLDIDNCLMESDTYSSRDDFPHFGSRLLAVQQYNLRRQPSRVRDLWRDRRYPLQWYTFWAVLWVGGITIVLAFLQLAASVIQTYYSARGDKK